MRNEEEFYFMNKKLEISGDGYEIALENDDGSRLVWLSITKPNISLTASIALTWKDAVSALELMAQQIKDWKIT